MSKRVTLTNDDVELILFLLDKISFITPYNEKEYLAIQRKQQLIGKLKTEPSSQKVSSSSDKPIITH